MERRRFGTLLLTLFAGLAMTLAGVGVYGRAGAPGAAIVNESFARKWWPEGGAVGRGIKLGAGSRRPALRVVGVAGNVSQLSLDAEPLPEIFVPFAPSEPAARMVMIRTAGDPEPLVPAVRRRVAMLDRSLAIESLRPVGGGEGAALAQRDRHGAEVRRVREVDGRDGQLSRRRCGPVEVGIEQIVAVTRRRQRAEHAMAGLTSSFASAPIITIHQS